MYKSKEKYPFLQVLEDNWQDIRDEYLAVATNPDMHAWPENKIYDGGWDTYGLWGFGIKRKKNCERCPKTTKALSRFPASRWRASRACTWHAHQTARRLRQMGAIRLALPPRPDRPRRLRNAQSGQRRGSGKRARSRSSATPPNTKSGTAPRPRASSSCSTSATRPSGSGFFSTRSSPPTWNSTSRITGRKCPSQRRPALSPGASPTWAASGAPTSMNTKK